MQRIKMAELDDVMFSDEEFEKIEKVASELMDFLKEKNLTVGQACEALLRCKVNLLEVRLD